MGITFTIRDQLTKQVKIEGEDEFDVTFKVAANSGLLDFGAAYQQSKEGTPVLGEAIVRYIKKHLISWSLKEPISRLDEIDDPAILTEIFNVMITATTEALDKQKN